MPGRNLRPRTVGCVIHHAEAPNRCQQPRGRVHKSAVEPKNHRLQARLSGLISLRQGNRHSHSRPRRRPLARPSRQVGALDDRIQPPNLPISETVEEAIVHYADRLHVRINDGRTNPRCLRSLLNASDSREVAGISRIALHRLSLGCPSTNRQQ